MAFIYDLSDTWNNAGISFNGIKLNATDTASASGSKLIDLQINGASKFTVGKTGAVIATGLIESTVGGFRFPDGTTQTTKATVNSVSGTGTVNGITLTGSVTDSGSLTLGGTLGNIANNQLTNSAITINGTSTPLGGSIAVGTVTSVAGTGTVSGLSLTGSVTTSGSLTLGGTLVLTSGQVTDGLGYTPYNATNPAGYTTNVGTVTSVAGTGTVNGLTLTGSITTSGSLTLGGTLGNIANSQLTNSAITINGTSTALGGSISVGTVTSVAALALGTSGTDLASSVANGTTTPVITLNVPTASAANRGALSPSDWSTFNAKQAALVSGTNIKTVGGASLLGSGDVGTIGLAYGGTGATTESGARTALGLGTAAVLNAGVAGGVATLDGSGTVPTSQLPGAVLGGLNYQGTWNASTNTPTLASSTGSKGYYYVVSTAGSTNLNGITDWKIGDWAVYDGSSWQKVDNTDAVSSVNGFTGAVVLTTSDVAQGTNLYFTQAAARASVSAGTGISYNSTTGVITNSAPDQTVALTGAGTTTVTGTYPNFTITSNDSTVGTVTSVAASGGTTGLTFTGSPITTAGTLTLGGTLAVANGGTGATTLTSGYVLKGNGTSAVSASVLYDDGTNIGIGTTSPSALFHISRNGGGDIGALVSQTNGGNGTTARYRATHGSGAAFNLQAGNGHVDLKVTSNHHLTFGTNDTERFRIGASGQFGIGGATYGSAGQVLTSGGASAAPTWTTPTTGTVTSVGGTGTVNGITLTGTVTSSGSLTLGGAITGFLPLTGGTLSGGVNVQGASFPANGVGMELLWDGTQSVLQSYNRNIASYQPLRLDGSVLQLFTNGTEKARLDSSGNVGIGNSAPVAKLQVKGGGSITSLATWNTAPNTMFELANPAVRFGVGYDASDQVLLQAFDSTNAARNIGMQVYGGSVGIGTATPVSRLNVSGTTGFTWPDGGGTSSGLVTIGTQGTGGSLFINTASLNTGFASGLAIDGTYSHPSSVVNIKAVGVKSGGDYNSSLAFHTSFETTLSEKMRILSGGNVGVGTSSPATKFVVSNGGAGGLEFDTNGLMQSYNRSTSAYQFMYFDAAQILFRPSGTERMRLDASGVLLINRSSTSGLGKLNVDGGADFTGGNVYLARDTGNVGIGTGTLGNKLSVAGGQINAVADEAYGIALNATTGNVRVIPYAAAYSGSVLVSYSAGYAGYGPFTVDAANIRFWTNGNERARIDGSGNVIVGATSGNGRLTVRGAGTTGSTYSFEAATSGGNTRFIVADNGQADFYNSSNALSMRIDSSGNVGIGTSGPLSRLDVREANRADSTNIANVGVYTTTAQSTGVGGTLALGGLFNGSDLAPFASIRGGKQNSINNNYDGYLAFQTIANGGVLTERLRIDSTGKVGIGSNNPTELLTINGVGANAGYPLITFNDQGTNRGQIGYTFDFGYFHVSSASTLAFRTAGSERMRIDTSGNVGIGTTSPAFKTDVVGDIHASSSVFTGSNTDGWGRFINSGGALYIQAGSLNSGAATAQPIIFTNMYGGSERMRIDSSGNLLVGTTAAPVSGVSGVQIAPLFVRIGASSTSNTGLLSFNNPNGEVGLVTVSGTATAYNTSSDYRLKEIDGPIANSGAYIDALKPVQGSWKADGSRFIGLLAHEVQEVSETPIATGEKDGEKMQAMDYSAPELIANLIAELQSLRARVAELEGN